MGGKALIAKAAQGKGRASKKTRMPGREGLQGKAEREGVKRNRVAKRSLSHRTLIKWLTPPQTV